MGRKNVRTRLVVLCAVGIALLGTGACTPTVNVLGVYFPAWLVSAVIGLVVAYVGVSLLARRPALRSLGRSGALFCSLTVTVGMLAWWLLFSRF